MTTRPILQFALLIVFGVSASVAFAQCPNQRPIYNPIYNPPIYTQPIYEGPVYSQPVYETPIYNPAQVVVDNPVQVVRKPSPVDVARSHTEEAKQLFAKGEYLAAKKKLDEVVKLVPKDTNAYQFRSLAAFAAQNYQDAAADVYDALQLGNTWNRPVIRSLYNQQFKTYQTQLATLKRDTAKTPSMQGHFLLAYHHLVNEQWAQAKLQLEKVLELQPEEPVSTQLYAAVKQKLVAQVGAAGGTGHPVIQHTGPRPGH